MIRPQHDEMARKVDELLEKGFVHKSLSPYAVPALLTPNKVDPRE